MRLVRHPTIAGYLDYNPGPQRGADLFVNTGGTSSPFYGQQRGPSIFVDSGGTNTPFYNGRQRGVNTFVSSGGPTAPFYGKQRGADTFVNSGGVNMPFYGEPIVYNGNDLGYYNNGAGGRLLINQTPRFNQAPPPNADQYGGGQGTSSPQQGWAWGSQRINQAPLFNVNQEPLNNFQYFGGGGQGTSGPLQGRTWGGEEDDLDGQTWDSI